MAFAAATALHAGVAAVVLAPAPMPMPMPEPIQIEIVSIAAAPPQASADAMETAEAKEPDLMQADIAPAGALPEPAIEPDPLAAEPVPGGPVPQPIAEKPPLPRPPRTRPRQTGAAAEAPSAQSSAPSTPSPEPSASGTSAPQAPAIDAVAAPPMNTAPQTDSAYVGRLLAWLERFKEYPRAARLRRMEGQVIVRLSILADGRIAAATVATSSGHPVLDSAAFDTVRRANPLPAPDGGPVELLVPIVFVLRD